MFVMNLLCAVAAAQPSCPANMDFASVTLPSPSSQTATFQECLLIQKFACFPTATRCAADCDQDDDKYVRNHASSSTCIMGPV